MAKEFNKAENSKALKADSVARRDGKAPATKPYEVASGKSVRQGGVRKLAGDTVQLTQADAERLLHKGVVVTPGQAAKAGAKGEAPANPLAVHLDANAPDVIAAVEAGKFDADTLAQLAQLEADGKGRKTVLDAIDAAQKPAE